MTNLKQIKRIKQTIKKRDHNSSLKSEAKTHIKKVIKAIKEKNQKFANEEFSIATSKIDKLSKKNIIHKNTAARQKKRLNKKIKLMNINNS